MGRVDHPLGVGHHAQNAAVFRQDTGDIGHGTVGVLRIGKGNAILILQRCQADSVDGEVSIMMGDRNL